MTEHVSGLRGGEYVLAFPPSEDRVHFDLEVLGDSALSASWYERAEALP